MSAWVHELGHAPVDAMFDITRSIRILIDA